jgi:hypothetical protein
METKPGERECAVTTITEILTNEGPAEIAAQIANLGGYVKTKPPKGGRRQWVIQCPHPSHPDLNPSATLSEAIDGTALMYCFGGSCNTKPSDVWFRESTQRLRDRTQFIPAKPRSSSSGGSGGGIEVATYVYHDPAGNEYHKIRYDLGGGHKRFQWRTIKGATYIVGLLNTALEDLLPYGSEQLADKPGQPVLWVEGEKDADRAHQLGLLALSSAGGAAGPLPDLSMLTGRVVKIVADRDPAGLHHARQVLEAIKPYASEYSRIVGPAPRQRGSDLTDHLDAGHTINDLEEDPELADTIEPPTDDTTDTSPYDSAVQRRFAELRILEDAKLLLAVHKAGEAHPLDAINLTEFLTQPDETEQYRVTGLWPAQGRVLLAAAAKAGKTTIVVGNILPSLVDGRAFLGEHSTQPVTGRVTYLNMEVGERIIRTWMRRAGIINTDQVNVVNLRGKASALTLATQQGRQRFAAFLRNLETEAVILDPLAPLLATLGLDENSNTDVAMFFSWWAETLQIADVTDDLVVHHTGHAGQRSRGASRLLDEPDAIWTLTKGLGTDLADDETLGSTQPRFLTAYGRDVDKPEEGLDHNPDTGHLAFNGQTRSQTKAVGKANHITDILQDQTPRSINQICQTVGGNRNSTYAAVKKMVDDGSLFEVSKSKNGHPLYVVDTTK